MKDIRKKTVLAFTIVVMIVGIFLLTMCEYPGFPERNPGKWGSAQYGKDVFGK